MKKPAIIREKGGSNPLRPAFKNSELGLIPADWEVKRLGDVCEITTGHKDVNEGCKEGQFPFFTCSKNVFASNSYSFDCEAILVAGNGDVGNLHYFNGRFEAYQRTYVLHGFEENIAYVFHELNHNLMSRLNDGKIGSSIPYITIDRLKGFMFPLPPSAEQRRIVAALSDADAWIESLDKLIEKKKLVKQGAMQALLSGKTRLPGFSGKWVEKRLGDCMIVNPSNDRMLPETFFYIDLESVTKGRLADVPEIQKVTAPSRAQRLFQKGDILFQTVRPYQNNNLFVDFEAKQFVASTGYAILRAKCDTDARWMFEIIQTPQFTDHVMDNCTGTGYPAINPGKLAEIPFLMPPSLAEQRGIAAILSDMDAELAALSREKAKAEQIKQGMMQELLTGRTRVGGFAAHGEARDGEERDV